MLTITGPGPQLNGLTPIDYSVARGAAVLNLSLAGPDRSENVVKALARALESNRVVVAAAGNGGKEVRRYPAA